MTTIKRPLYLDNAIKRHLAGEAIGNIAKDIGIAYGRLCKEIAGSGNGFKDKGRIKHKFNVADLHKQHVEGKSILQLSNEIGVARITLNRWFNAAGLSVRNMTEAQTLRFKDATKEYTSRITKAAHKSRRGQKDSIKTLTKRAQFKARKVGMFEREIIDHLKGMGVDCVGQKPIGTYNIDIFLNELGIAVEVYSTHPGKGRMADLHKRSEYILNLGHSLLDVQCNYPRRVFDISDVCDKIVAFSEFCRSNKTKLGHHGVVRGNGNIAPTSSHETDNFPLVKSF